MATKSEKVSEAIASRGSMPDGKGGPGKKGVNLLGIVKKLTAKRKMKEEKGEVEDKKESAKEEAAEQD